MAIWSQTFSFLHICSHFLDSINYIKLSKVNMFSFSIALFLNGCLLHQQTLPQFPSHIALCSRKLSITNRSCICLSSLVYSLSATLAVSIAIEGYNGNFPIWNSVAHFQYAKSAMSTLNILHKMSSESQA